jgi:methylenetetrahydrofolate reductase (NADPH)
MTWPTSRARWPPGPIRRSPSPSTTNYTQLARFSDACGAEIPRWIRLRLQGYGDDRDSIRAFGLDVVTDLCEQLLSVGVPGLHFYTMNQTEPTLELWARLGLPR